MLHEMLPKMLKVFGKVVCYKALPSLVCLIGVLVAGQRVAVNRYGSQGFFRHWF